MPPKQVAAVYVLSWRWTKTVDMDDDDFRDVSPLKAMLTERATNWCFQLESTKREDGTDNLHYQGYMKVKERQRPKALASILNDEFRGIDMQACSSAGRDALARYCMKADTRVAGPWADREVYMGDDLPTKLLRWQESIRVTITRPVHPRKIYWVHDPEGASGKSIFAKYMAFHHGVVKLTFGDPASLLYAVSSRAPARAYFFDLSRSKGQGSSMNDIYQAIEAIKDGHYTSTKYESKDVLMSRPHVFVFSNHLPELTALSQDRWKVIRIREKHRPPPIQCEEDLYDQDECFEEVPLPKRQRIV